VPLAVGLTDGATEGFHLFSGRNVAPGKATEILKDAYVFRPRTTGAWTRLGDIAPKGERARCVMAGTAIAASPSGGFLAPGRAILVIGGADGRKLLELEDLGKQIEKAKGTPQEKALEALKSEILENHPGFSRDVLAYDPKTDTWTKAGEFPTGSHVTTTAVEWEGAIVIPSGEIRPGVRSPKVWQAASPRGE